MLQRTRILVALGTILFANDVLAQPIHFGSADDPREQRRVGWWSQDQILDVYGGLSLIGVRWYGSVGATASLQTATVGARFSKNIRYSTDGIYEPDISEPYDALRAIEFIRIADDRRGIYLRAGPIQRARLGTGHLVDHYSTRTAWDTRTVGVEGAWHTPLLQLEAFSGNVLMNGVTGARLGLQPLFWADHTLTRSFELGFSYVTDLETHRAERTPLTGYNVDVQFNAFSFGDVHLTPFASFAWYEAEGSGLGFGAAFHSPNFVDLLRFSLRMGLFYNSREFIPGYVGSFYQVSNPYSRPLDTEAFTRREPVIEPADISLQEARGGNTLVTEMRVMVFRQFEFWQQFKRHYGTQSLSQYHVRFFLTVPNFMLVDVGVDRGRLDGFVSVFGTIGDVSALVFNAHYRFRQPFWTFVSARYTYEEQIVTDDVTYYLVQRRFEPAAGIRLIW
jgi:hypothetical protein